MLAHLRTITHHKEKWPASKEQVRQVRFIHSLVVRHIKEGVPVERNRHYFEEFESSQNTNNETNLDSREEAALEVVE